MRQTWEEIGLDLAEKHFLCVGQLDDREITTSLGKRLLMVLSPIVFLQLVPDEQPVDPSPETTLHWTPLANLAARRPTWSTVTVDISSRLAPKHSIVRNAIQFLVGSMKFDAIVLNADDALRPGWSIRRWTAWLDWGFSDEPDAKHLKEPTHTHDSEELRLWGLTLGMTLDLVGHMRIPFPLPPSALPGSVGAEKVLAPSMT